MVRFVIDVEGSKTATIIENSRIFDKKLKKKYFVFEKKSVTSPLGVVLS